MLDLDAVLVSPEHDAVALPDIRVEIGGTELGRTLEQQLHRVLRAARAAFSSGLADGGSAIAALSA